MKCSFCNESDVAEKIGVAMLALDEDEISPGDLPMPKLDGKAVCLRCAHNASHSWQLGARTPDEIPCPVMDGEGNVIRWGTYPNIDMS